GSDIIPIIAPIGVGPQGETYNINADTAAGAIAGALGASKLLMLTDVAGVLDENNELIPTLAEGQARDLLDKGVITGGMIPKVETCLDAVRRGADAVHILDGRIKHVLLLEIFTAHGVGTMIRADG
ncbi:MAG: acetylglutamate kinase, partial [Alphaproteobacteria bacterium]|nr:acetylglutamate kinase [Alphaproteobacteria bacterium]